MIEWQSVGSQHPKQYVCAYCGLNVGAHIGIYGQDRLERRPDLVYICPKCAKPTYFSAYGHQVPGPAPGNNVGHLPKDVQQLYQEARVAAGAGAPTASVLACRKLLMNIAVAHGAKAGESFAHYVTFLGDKGFVPPNGKGWVDHIRTKGNEATHEIAVLTYDDATQLISFAEMLLKFIFEFPAKLPAAPTPP